MLSLLRSIKNTMNFNTELSYKLLEKEEHFQRSNKRLGGTTKLDDRLP